jgi:hypothetical protein
MILNSPALLPINELSSASKMPSSAALVVAPEAVESHSASLLPPVTLNVPAQPKAPKVRIITKIAAARAL